MLPLRVRLSLLAVQLVGAATLLRSIAFDYWITVVTSIVLIVAAMAAQRGRAWGVGLAFATSMWFLVCLAVGIAPPWFALVGLVGALPFAQTLRSFARFDKGATALLALLATTSGAAVALAWKEIALSVFRMIPASRPSLYPHHGFAVAAALAVVVAAIASRNRLRTTPEETRVRIGERVRVSEGADTAIAEMLDDAHEAEEEADRNARAMARRA